MGRGGFRSALWEKESRGEYSGDLLLQEGNSDSCIQYPHTELMRSFLTAAGVQRNGRKWQAPMFCRQLLPGGNGLLRGRRVSVLQLPLDSFEALNASIRPQREEQELSTSRNLRPEAFDP